MKNKKFTNRPAVPYNKCGGKKGKGCSLNVSKRVIEYPYYIEDKKAA